MVTSTNISSLFSTWGRDPDRKVYLSVLNLEEIEGGPCKGTSSKMLTTAGLTGLDDPAIHFCVEGMEGLELMLTCLATPGLTSAADSPGSYSYEYMYAKTILSELQEHAKRAQTRRTVMAEVSVEICSGSILS